MVNDGATSIRTLRAPLRSSQPAACERVMLFTLTLPVARSFIVTVSVHVAPCVTPAAGSRGKKLRNDPTIGDTAWAALLSDGTGLWKSPWGVSRPTNASPLATPRSTFIGTVVPESGMIESMLIVIG